MEYSVHAQMGATSSLIARPHMQFDLKLENFWNFICYRRPEKCQCVGCNNWRTLPESLHEHSDILCRNSFVAWEEHRPNLVTTEGKNDLLTQYFKGSSYTATWYVGLVNNAGFTQYLAADTAAQIGGTNQWAEATGYSQATRVTWVGGSAAAGSIDNSASAAVFSINTGITIRGGFLASTNTKGGTTGKLYGEVDFTEGSRILLNGDTLTVTNTITVT